ncbi:HindVP family restriction endonuclease [Escherichia coli]
MRPASTSYCALGIMHSCSDKFHEIRKIFESTCESIQHWGNETEVLSKKENILNCLNTFQENFLDYQKPFFNATIMENKRQEPNIRSKCL